MKKQYVMGFAFFMIDGNKFVALINKSSGWQSGMINGLGGKIKENESPIEAMKREFREEFGSSIGIWNGAWQQISVVEFENAIIYVFKNEASIMLNRYFSYTTEEGVVRIYKVKDLMHYENFVPHVLWSIGLCLEKNLPEVSSIRINTNIEHT